MFKIIHEGYGDIFYATHQSAGFDICSNTDTRVEPGTWCLIETGLKIVEAKTLSLESLSDIVLIPEIQIRPRSGLARKFGISILNSPSTIDADYRGEIKVMLMNHGLKNFEVKKGDRIAQAVCTLCFQSKSFPVKEKERGDGAFGSTGFS
jgi:dUTP pyrophosphatase